MTTQKAQISIQFNWIFVLFVGALIIGFFTLLVINYGNIVSRNADQELSSDLQSLFLQAKVSRQSTGLVELPSVEVKYTCDDACNAFGCPSSFVSGKASPIQTELMPVFSPALLQGNEMVTWSQDWMLPFRVDSFLYLTSPQIAYVFVGTGDVKDIVYSELPPELINFRGKVRRGMTKLNWTANSPPSLKGYYKLRFIVFDTQANVLPSISTSIAAKDISAVLIDGNIASGMLKFCKYTGSSFACLPAPTDTSSYLGKASLMGAIFSENKEMYDCNMKKAVLHLNKVAEVYANRTTALLTVSADANCKKTFDDTAFALAGMLNKTKPENIGRPLDLSVLQTPASTIAIQEQNAQLYSCPDIY